MQDSCQESQTYHTEHRPLAFSEHTVHISNAFTSLQFWVYAASHDEELDLFYSNDAQAWCGLKLNIDAMFNSRVRTCELTLSPFGETSVAVVPADPMAKLNLQVPAACTFQERSSLSWQLIGTGLVGLMLFYVAPLFAESVTFRISTGGLLSVLLFSIILLFIVLRCVAVCCSHALFFPYCSFNHPSVHRPPVRYLLLLMRCLAVSILL